MTNTFRRRGSAHRRRVRASAVVGVAAIVLSMSACAFDPATVPIPGTTVSGGTYRLHIEFANVLNLPPGAKVIANGVEVGNLAGVRISDSAATSGYVVADVRIKDSVRLPGDLTVELRQATPLGDVHIALITDPRSTAATLSPDGTIPLAQTARPAQVEDTLAGLATAIGSGAITDIQDTVRQLNAVLPADPAETTRVFAAFGADLTGVAGELGSIDQLLDGLNRNTDVLLAEMPALQRMLTDQGVEQLSASMDSVIRIFYIFTNLAPVARSAVWLAPFVQSADAAATAFIPMLLGTQPLDLNAPTNLKALVDLIQNKLIPFAERGAKVNIVRASVSGPEVDAVSPTDRTEQIIAALRMIGAVR